MGIRDAVNALLGGDRKREERERGEEKLRRAFKERCGHFKALLSANKRALSAMADIEEALKTGRLFGMSFVRARCTTVLAGVHSMVRHLDALTGGAYPELFDKLRTIRRDIDAAIAPKTGESGGPPVLPIERAGLSLAHETGGKMAGLGEARQRLGREIPRGFVITASGYRRFMSANNLPEEIHRRVQLTDFSRLDAVFALSSSLQQLVMAAPLPADLESAILGQYALLAGQQPDMRLAVRSSAIGEDAPGSSFAGQYRSELNVSGDGLIDAYKEVVASKYSVTAMTYRINRGIPDDEVAMCVGCLEMIRAEAGGVVYSADPLGREKAVIINAAPGLPRAVVDGSVDADVYHVSREEPQAIEQRHVPVKRYRLEFSPEHGIARLPLSKEEGAKPCLTDERILAVARTALDFESSYGYPQDVEWAFARDGRLVILQNRALPGLEESAEALPPPEGTEVLAEGGVCAGSGVGAGPVVVVRREADMLRFPHGGVLVVEQAHARWAPILNRAAAVVSEYGGIAGHLAGVAREYGIPALFGVKEAARLLVNDMEVTVDADSRRILRGRVEELLARKQTPPNVFAGSPVYGALARAARLIVPLRLLNPEAPDFTPAHCETLHDITRFCHEKSVEEMFRVDETLFYSRCGKQLTCQGAKLQYFVVDMEKGFTGPVRGKYVELDQIRSRPMRALWQGMIAVPWEGPPGTGVRNFFSIVAQSALNPELETTSASTRMLRNYFLVDEDYCLLQAVFGYHFCTVEAQTGETPQENYINFHFKGGAANLTRRILRVGTIADVLSEHGFIVECKEDVLSARTEELPAEKALDLLVILGHLLIHTRQMDAAMNGEGSRDAFADSLREGIARLPVRGCL